jgi:Arc-like DNA binding domain
MARKSTDTVQLKLRFSETLRRKLERAAARNNRSMNTEIIHRLEESFALAAAERAGAAAARHDLENSSDTEIGEKLDKIFALLQAAQSKDDGEKK